jgi:hypothetical protein
MNTFLGFKTEEILTCLLLIVVGYFIAKMFSGCGCSNNGFSVGIRKKDGNTCKEGDRCYSLQDSEYAYKCPTTGICHNLVIDDGTVVPCINPEGVYVGSSNHTYCIDGKGIDEKCTKNSDCKSGVCYKMPLNPNDPKPSKGYCVGVCDNPLKLFPDCDKCRNPKFGGPNCGECANKNKALPNCTSCKEGFGGPMCNKCKNDSHDINTNCKECVNKSFVYPDCTSLKPCNMLTSMQCSNSMFCSLKPGTNECIPKKGDCSYDEQNCNNAKNCFWGSVAKGRTMCHNKIVSGGVCTIDDRCLSGECTNNKCE